MATINERAEHAESVLFERYDELNALWQKAEKEFTAHHIPDTVSYEYYRPTCSEEAAEDPVVKLLGLSKKNGAWRICHGEYDYQAPYGEVDWTPITECSATLRVYSTQWLPKLREAIVAASERFIPRVEEAIERLRKELSVEPEVSIEQLLAERAKLNGRHPKK
ncbi:MAG: hypothetical protein JWP89_2617 [Schlesneria sp.]|nr:hypothetical protein [Schlesneria sp.]